VAGVSPLVRLPQLVGVLPAVKAIPTTVPSVVVHIPLNFLSNRHLLTQRLVMRFKKGMVAKINESDKLMVF
jgi:hypothetical protein